MTHLLALCVLAFPVDPPTPAQSAPEKLSIPVDSDRWDFQGQVAVTEYKGRKCLALNGGVAILKDFEMRDGVIDADVATTANRGFLGFQFRLTSDGAFCEEVYLRPHKSGLPDALQYTPVLNTGANWQLYSGPGFIAPVDIPRSAWFHVRLEVSGAQARFYVKDMKHPALVMDDLKTGVQKGLVALWVLFGQSYYSDIEIRKTPDAPCQRHLPPMRPGTITQWSLSQSFDTLKRDVESPPSDGDTIQWQEVEAEPPGLVAIYRYRQAPHLQVTFASDFSKRLDPQPGTKLIYARTTIKSDRDQLRKLYIGYSDEVTLFLDGRPLFRGRSAQNFRDPGFLGIVDPENDAVYLPLKKGDNELMLALSELGGGWGFTCRLEEAD